MILKRNRKIAVNKAVREAIDSYPEGLCFSSLNGKPILVNSQMNILISRLTGHTIIEANDVWNELEQTESKNNCTKLHMKQTLKDCKENDNSIIFVFPDKKIWRFQRKYLINENEYIMQIKADEITELYKISEELYHNNERLLQFQERQRTFISNIVHINQEKEILSAKMRIHDELGRCLVATKKALNEGTLKSDRHSLLKGWEEAIMNMTNIPLQSKETPLEDELVKVADMIGCHVEFIGQQPKERNTLLLLYSAIREALTNAVRHADANILTVEISHVSYTCHAEIYSNGLTEVSEITEGGGLGSLRKRLEQEGASMRIDCKNGVRLIVDIPENIGEEFL